MKDRNHYSSMPTSVLLEEAHLYGVNAEMGVALAQRLNETYQPHGRRLTFDTPKEKTQ